MMMRSISYSKTAIALGSVAFGLFYVGGLAYFEALESLIDGAQYQPASVGDFLALYAPVAAILITVSVVFGFLLFDAWRPLGRPLRSWQRWVLVPLSGFLVAAGLIFGYLQWADPSGGNSELLDLLIYLGAVGILPLEALLILLPQPTFVPPHPPTPLHSENDPKGARAEAIAMQQPATPQSLLIEANGSDPQFRVQFSDLIVVEAADNYCKFHYLKDGQRKTKILRMKMKEAEEALQGHAGFHRVHRSFLVNADMVEQVQGNSQAYRLQMLHLEEHVPVSRSFDVEVLRREGE
jgi:DNA-binding LytR/AlgR family response regulator